MNKPFIGDLLALHDKNRTVEACWLAGAESQNRFVTVFVSNATWSLIIK